MLDGLVSRQPLLLVEDVDQLLDELERWVKPQLLPLGRGPGLVRALGCEWSGWAG